MKFSRARVEHPRMPGPVTNPSSDLNACQHHCERTSAASGAHQIAVSQSFPWQVRTSSRRCSLSARVEASLLSFVLLCAAFARDAKNSYFPLESAKDLVAIGSEIRAVTYRGRRSIQLIPPVGHENADEDMLAVLTGPDFRDGTIEVEVAGAPRAGAPADVRGFIGVAFRVQAKGTTGEYFYLRPTNARCDDQLRRNTQPSTSRPRIFPGNGCVRRAPECTNRMSIWSRECGRG